MDMVDGAKLFMQTNCWVYILQPRQESPTIRISFALKAKEMLRDASQADLLYYRQFTQVAEAMGHKLFLENLSTDSLYSCIQYVNPEMKDLNGDFRVVNEEE